MVAKWSQWTHAEGPVLVVSITLLIKVLASIGDI